MKERLSPEIKFDIPLVTEEQIEKALKALDPTKTAGADQISARFVQMSATVLSRHLSYIVNTSIRTGVFPSSWKYAKVFPIFKGGCAKDCNNYRPISVLTILSKILETHVHDALYSFLSKYNLISAHQSGFRKNHSCLTGLTTLVSKWRGFLDEGKIIGCVNIDLRKAFDLINFEIMLKKLEIYGCSISTVLWFKSYLENRKQAVFIDDKHSNFLPVNYGIPQGSILGPLLYILYVNDLPLMLKHENILIYADDTSLYAVASTVRDLNIMLNAELSTVNKWLKSNRLVLNVKKTNCMLICNKQRRYKLRQDKLDIYVDGTAIANVTKHNVLGVIIDNCLTFDEQVENICKKLSKYVYLLCHIKDCLTYEAKQTFYNSYILPCIDYCCTVWGYTSKTNIDKIFTYQKRIGRIITTDYECSTNFMFNKLGWLTVYERIDFITVQLVYKCLYEEMPEPLQKMFTLRNTQRFNPLRNTGVDLTLPRSHTEARKKSFDFVGATIWNTLPVDIRFITSLCIFKYLVKQYILSKRQF